ncbi:MULTISPECIES: AbgT family transporter [Hyphobacterium]|uniref:AbgT family transporter n=1 Tax=Hyphobacterium vulgare TaxID=1736751 RepID=A0ABV6ZST7_9PROT
MSDKTPGAAPAEHQKGILGLIERTGNRLPDPVFIFFYLIIAMAIVSIVADFANMAVEHPTRVDDAGNPVIVDAISVFSPDSIRHLLVEMPEIFTGFHPLGYVLVVMLGAGVAERAGLFGTAMRAAVRDVPKFLLTPAVALVAMMGNLAADAAYVVLIPLAAVIFAAAGRHPIAGITAAFAGVSGGFSANLLPGQLDALLFGITEAVVQPLDPGWVMNIAGNWYFIAAMTILFTPVIWYVTDRIIEPRLGKWTGGAVLGSTNPDDDASAELTAGQKKGLAHAGIAVLVIALVWILLTVDVLALVTGGSASLYGGNAPLFSADTSLSATQRLVPFFSSLVAGFMLLFIFAGIAYGRAAGTIRNHRDIVDMMAGAMKDMGYYLVLAFFAAYFVELFNQSQLGLIFAVNGANGIENSGLPLPIVLGLIVLFAAVLNLFVGSASAKWALLAPVLVPMLMLLGVSPEMATAAYRVGDSGTNIITPLMVYFPLILVFAQRWVPSFGLGSLTASMLPYSIWLLITGIAMTVLWVFLNLPLGPGATVQYVLPGAG